MLAGMGAGGAIEKDWREVTGKGRTTFDRHRDKLIEAGRVELGEGGRFRVVETAPSNRSAAAPSLSAPALVMPDAPSQLSEMQERLLCGLVLRGAKGLSEQVALDAGCSGEIQELHARCPELVTFEAGCWRASPMVIEELRPWAKEYILQKLEDGMTEAEWIECVGANKAFVRELIEELVEEGTVELCSRGGFYNVRPLAA